MGYLGNDLAFVANKRRGLACHIITCMPRHVSDSVKC